MIIYLSNIRTIVLLCLVCGIVCIPRPDEEAKKTIASKNEINHVTTDTNKTSNSSQQTANDNRQIVSRPGENDTLSSGKNNAGPKKDGTYDETQINKTSVQSNSIARKLQKRRGEITSNIEVNDAGDVIGEIIIPDDSESNDFKIDNDNNNIVGNDNDGDFVGSINIDGDNIEGTLQMPDEFVNNNNVGENKVGDDDIHGTFETPDDPDGGNDGTQGPIETPDGGDNDGIEGTMEIPDDRNDDDGIEGTIEIPDDGDKDDGIEGTIETPDDRDKDDGIEGTIETPDDGDKDDGIEGTIETPDDGDKDDGIEGAIEIPDDGDKDDGIEGTIETPDDGDKDDGIEGTIETPDDGDKDDGIEGNIEIPDDGDNDSNNDINNDSGAIIGNITIDSDENIEGTIEFPDDYFELGSGHGSNNKDNGDDNHGYDSNNNDIDDKHNEPPKNYDKYKENETCWMSLDSQKYMNTLNKLDETYKKARQEYQNDIGPAFDKKMMEVLMSSQGKAPRAIHQAQGDPSIIPAGLNLGGYGMMRMQGSLLFFHRLKLRNNTRFQVNFLQTSLLHMSLSARLSLNDLHLQGAYERTNTEGEMNVLYFVPNYGELNVLLKQVGYKMEGRLRLLNNRLMIELISSEIAAKDVLLTYTNSSSSTKILPQDNIDDFVDRLKSDLDLWLKDYFNDYLMYFGIVGGKNTDVQVYEKQKTSEANAYATYVIKVIKQRIRTLGFDNIVLPQLTIITATLQQVKMISGKLRGFDSMYRRSVATTKKEDNIRKFDFIVGFSNLKVEYTYEAILGPGEPVVTGILVLSADDLTARLQLAQVDGSQTASINIDTIMQLKSEALTVEGPANRLIANFKYILENPILAVMTNVLKHNLRMLKTLPGCGPKLWGGKGRQWQLTPYKSRFNKDKPAEIPSKTAEEPDDPSPPGSEPEQLPSNGDDSDVSGSPPFNNPPELPDREGQFIQTDDDNEWADYVFSKNDSVEIEAPIDGKVQTLKLERNENFILKKVT